MVNKVKKSVSPNNTVIGTTAIGSKCIASMRRQDQSDHTLRTQADMVYLEELGRKEYLKFQA